MKQKFFVVVFIGILGGMTLLHARQQIEKENGKYVTTIQQEFTVQPGGKLIIDDIVGDVRITSWSKNQVFVEEKMVMEVLTREEAEKIVEKTKSDYSQTNNTVRIIGGNGRSWVQRNFTVKVPTEFDLDVKISAGDIDLTSVNGQVALATSGGDIRASNLKGGLDAKTSGGDLDFSEIDGTLNAKTSGGDIALSNLGGKAEVKTSGGNIRLRGAKNEVELKTSGGEIEVSNVNGNLIVATSGGEIEVIDCKGTCDVRTSGGNIRAKNLLNGLDAHTSGGDVIAESIFGALVCHTSGGDLELSDIRGSVNGTTSGGDINLELTLTDFSKPHSINLTTSAGNLELIIPAQLPASLSAEIHLGKRQRYLNRYDIYSDFPLTKAKVEESGQDIIRATGELNGGGDSIQLKTSAGDIRIKKSTR